MWSVTHFIVYSCRKLTIFDFIYLTKNSKRYDLRFVKLKLVLMFQKALKLNYLTNNLPRHDKTNIVRLRPAWIQTRCSLTNPITSRETDMEQHGS
jgi:hypothetical protein